MTYIRHCMVMSGHTRYAVKRDVCRCFPTSSITIYRASQNTRSVAREYCKAVDLHSPKDHSKPGFFSRNPAITLGGIFVGIGLLLYRTSKNRKNFDAVQEKIMESSVISPYEAWELRSQNDLTSAKFVELYGQVIAAFPSDVASVQVLDQFVATILAESNPNGLKQTHHLERVLAGLPKDENGMVSVDAFMVALSLAVKGSVQERLQCLFSIAVRDRCTTAMNTHDARISLKQFERLLELLLLTYQIPSEKQVLEDKQSAVPFKTYHAATPSSLLEAALEPSPPKSGKDVPDGLSFNDVSSLLQSKRLCLWGECFSRLKSRKND